MKGAIKLALRLINQKTSSILLIDTPMNIGFAGWLIAKIFRVKYFYRARGDAYKEGIVTKRYVHAWFYKHIFLRQASGCIPVSYYLSRKMIKTVKYPLHLQVVNTPHLSCDTPNLNFNKRDKTILMVTGFGFMTKIKPIFNLLPTLARFVDEYEDFNIHILGDGTHLQSIKKYKHENYPTDKIVFAGRTDNVKDYYRDSFALLHITNLDAYPSVVNEARACGLPVLASNIGGCSEQIEHGKTGFLFNNNEPEKLFELLVKIAKQEVWESISKEGFYYVDTNHNSEQIGHEMVLAINTLLKNV
jgi:glycosyltransferase involved in cell wall biosynthesis